MVLRAETSYGSTSYIMLLNLGYVKIIKLYTIRRVFVNIRITLLINEHVPDDSEYMKENLTQTHFRVCIKSVINFNSLLI